MMSRSILPSSRSLSSVTTTMEEDRPETRDLCYYPGCRKDANCDCEICLASLNATLDLMPISVQKSSFTKLSVSRPRTVETTALSFDQSVLSTPTSIAPAGDFLQSTPNLKSSGRSRLNQKSEKKERKDWGYGSRISLSQKSEKKERKDWGYGSRISLRLVVVLSCLFAANGKFSWAAFEIFRPVLSREKVRNVGESSLAVQDLNWKLKFLEREFQSLVEDEVSNCSYTNSIWKIDQEGAILHSKCVIHKSGMEEVSIWGWPLQTAGLLTSGFSHRSFTILSGRLTEWSDGRIGYSIRKENSSWVQKKWGTSAVQLDPNTWILEYRRSSLLEGSSLYAVAVDLLKHRRMWRRFRGLKQEILSFFSQFGKMYDIDVKIPT